MQNLTYRGKMSNGQRQLRVGAMIRSALAEIFMRGDLAKEDINPGMITIFEVHMSADLKIATVYIVPFNRTPSNARQNTPQNNKNNDDSDHILSLLEKCHKHIRRLLAKRIHLKFTPILRFRIDPAPAQAARIESLLKSPALVKDINKGDD